MAPAVMDAARLKAFREQLLLQCFALNLNFIMLLSSSISDRMHHIRRGPCHLVGSTTGRISWHLSIVLYLYYACPGQSMFWYDAIFQYISSKEAIHALLEFATNIDATLHDWYWSFGKCSWFEGNVIGYLRPFIQPLAIVAIDKTEAIGLETKWDALETMKDIGTRTLSIMMDIPRPDPKVLGREVFELILRVPSTTTARTFYNIMPNIADGIHESLQMPLLSYITSESYFWELMWVYAPRDIAYISCVEWEKLQWLGISLLEKMVHDVFSLLATWPTTRKLGVLTAVITSKETLSALLCSVGYYGWKKADLPPLEIARTHFLALFALSYLTYLDYAGRAHPGPTFHEWFTSGFKPLVEFLDREFDESMMHASTSTDQAPTGRIPSRLLKTAPTHLQVPQDPPVIRRVKSYTGFDADLHVRPRSNSLPEPPFPSGRRRALRKVNGHYIPWTAEDVRLEDEKEAARLEANRILREGSLLYRMRDLITIHWNRRGIPDSTGEAAVESHPLKRRRSFAETVSDVANETLIRLADIPWPRTPSFTFGAGTSTSSTSATGPSTPKQITVTDEDSEDEIEDLLQCSGSEVAFDDVPTQEHRPSLLRRLSSVRSFADIKILVNGSPVPSDDEDNTPPLTADDYSRANTTPETSPIRRSSAFKRHSRGIVKSRKEGRVRR